ncbi:cytochrome p450 [Hirsutella rhossiliensis]|uniref:Cytochrome p450 domain-containing protein n=1 Tax=Hirsutella rhossiliensis TaxID=111463 RepID=A0A9P8MYY6_9HYPO|nr:cytochrome p450 domain-containing protein [Hirsutella rhossiliensis]KAH0963804.1 cytochrome p450 domain-containing protein [Hirsutella rhossiliensis]
MSKHFGDNVYLVLGASLLVAKAFCVLRNSTSRLPGPWLSKWTSLVLTYHWLKGTRCQYVHSLHQQYGPIVRLGPTEVDVSDMDSVKAIYTTKETFRKADWYKQFSTIGVETMFNTSDPEFFKRHRRLLAGPISESSLRVFHGLIRARANLAIDKMRDEMRTRGAADVLKWWYFLASDVISELTFGKPFQMLERGQKNEFAQHLESVMFMAAIRAAFPLLTSLARVVPLPFVDKAVESSRRQTRLAGGFVDEYKSLVESAPEDAPQTLFTNLLRAEQDEKLTHDEIRNEAELFIIAGSDTTANTLAFLVWTVCRRPDVQRALVEELRKLPEEYDGTQLRDLVYLNQVINESLRLYTAGPSGLPREVPPGGAHICGHYLEQGTIVCAQAWTLHRDPATFPSPDEFDPTRWEAPSKAMKDAFMPFGRGPRICLGQHLAMTELRFATAGFFLAFPDAKMSTLEGMCDDDMAQENHFVMSPKGKRCLVECASVASKC